MAEDGSRRAAVAAPYGGERGMAHRTADVSVTLVGVDGQSLRGREVTVAQRRHRLLFGSVASGIGGLAERPDAGGDSDTAGSGAAGSDARGSGAGGTEPGRSPEDERAASWLELFNFATLPFYWGRFEPVRGKPDTQRLLRAARWFTDRGCVVKGHPLAWHTVTADWLLELPVEAAVEAQLGRIRREVSDFAGLIDMWDVINEVVIMPLFDKYDNGITRICRRLGRIGTVRAVFDEARAANPHATLLLNDFDMSAAYECLIEGCLAAGITIDALGLQSHMHQGYWGEERTLSILDRFARYGLPIHFTETTLVSGHLMPADIVDLNDYQVSRWPSTPDGEERQAEEIVRHYRTLVSHPAVEAITYWGFGDDGAWLGAPSGLIRADGTAKPAYHALRELIKGEWWLPPTVLRTDDEGRIGFTGFLGDYEISSPDGRAHLRLDRPGPLRLTATPAR